MTDVTHAPDRMRVVASKKNYKLLIHSNRCVTSVNDQYRVCFTWSTGVPDEVEIIDYH